MKDFKKYYSIPVEPEILYAALVNAHTIKLWSGEDAIMIAEPNTEFELWNGSICGLNLEFEPSKKIVQEWYFGEQEEPSIVTIKLHEDKMNTSLEIRHTNIPDEAFDDICFGWDNAYVGALLSFYNEG